MSNINFTKLEITPTLSYEECVCFMCDKILQFTLDEMIPTNDVDSFYYQVYCPSCDEYVRVY